MRIKVLPLNAIVVYSGGILSTTFMDGAVIYAAAIPSADYEKTAVRLGYANGEDMNADHDLVHSLLAGWLGLPHSPALRHAADGIASDPMTDAEEDAVMAIQRFARTMGIDLWNLPTEKETHA